MSEMEIGALLLVATIVVLCSGVSIAFGLAAVAIAFLAIFGGPDALKAIPETFMSELSSFALLTVPMFVVLGAAIGLSRAGTDLYESLHRWLYRMPGGLVIANIFACGLFSALCGSSPATAAAIGKVGIPEMLRRGVPRALAAGSIAAGGTLGILIPPSITFIIYGLVTETSIARLFLAGVVPGILLVLIFSAYAWLASWRAARGAPVTERFSLKEKLDGIGRVLPFLGIIVAVTVFMYGGIATPSEVAGVAALMALAMVVVIYRTRLPQLWLILVSSTRETSMILMIIAAAALFSFMMSYLYITQTLAEWMVGLDLGKWGLILIINLFLLVVGCFLPPVAIILMSMPVLAPVLATGDVDLIWFGVILTINLEIGLITPPVGMNLFVIRGVAPSIPATEVLWGSLPFVALMTGFIVLMCIFPGIATGLPDLLLGVGR
ncbi:TRAP transporter large permease [Xanthobacter pseudotagetidis]|uniref:TRAP transporter large permease n=1 Tax=Xanthobacter pseudotagetidis TaxID=3119911 RepID=UPI003727C198